MSDLLEMKDISKRFGGVEALKAVSFSLKKGEVHALVGENGAGKSTLMKILIGMHRPDSGVIFLNGEKKVFNCMKDALNYGISMIFQEFNSVAHMTVADNIFLGREPYTKFHSVDYKKMHQDTKNILKRIGVDIDSKVDVSTLTVAKIQLIEIAKALSYDADIIIMDEPTSALSNNEIDNLYRIVKELAADGKTVVFISHKIDEIYRFCDRITVLRDGNLIGSDLVDNIDIDQLIMMMVNRQITEMYPKEEAEIKEKVLEVKNLSRKGNFEDISFYLRKGEILGVAGLMGAGRTELAESIFGMRRIDRGEIFVKGKKVSIKHPKDAIRHGIMMVPEDRTKTGLILKLSVKENILLTNLKKCMIAFYISKKKEKKSVETFSKILEIKMKDESQVVSALSGGNQQKVVVSRTLFSDPDIIIMDEPTRGIDVKTKADIHALMSKLANQGKAIIMISSEMPEVIGISDRIIVLHEGRLSGELTRAEADQQSVLRYAMGRNQ
ncbi:MAG: sugar ABC transporter ATP-binding protein [Eubacteriales bacterium]|nr:sugar ABC transporter ATP-binding protein [Eubacteriales bacterium]